MGAGLPASLLQAAALSSTNARVGPQASVRATYKTKGNDAAAAGKTNAQDVTQEQACQILKDGELDGQPLTPPQERAYGAICAGQQVQKAADGTVLIPRDYGLTLLDAIAS